MSLESDARHSAAAVLGRARALAASAASEELDPDADVLVSLASGEIALAEVEEDTLDRLTGRFGADALVRAILSTPADERPVGNRSEASQFAPEVAEPAVGRVVILPTRRSSWWSGRPTWMAAAASLCLVAVAVTLSSRSPWRQRPVLSDTSGAATSPIEQGPRLQPPSRPLGTERSVGAVEPQGKVAAPKIAATPEPSRARKPEAVPTTPEPIRAREPEAAQATPQPTRARETEAVATTPEPVRGGVPDPATPEPARARETAAVAATPEPVRVARAATGDRPRVAVIAFDNPTGWWGYQLGSSAASQLTTKLVNGGEFRVIERDRLQAILDEGQLHASGIVEPSQVARLGKLLGVEYVITGSLRDFNIRRRGGSGRIPGIGSVGASYTVAESSLDVRVIHVQTGEVVAAAQNKGEKRLGVGGSVRGNAYEDVTSSSMWNPTLAEEALGEALDRIAKTFTDQRNKFVTSAATEAAAAQEALAVPPGIAAVKADGTVYIDKGQSAGMTVGRRFHVLRIVDIIKDSAGKELDKVTKRVGLIEVTQVLTHSSICKIIEGRPDAKDLLEPY